MLITNETQMFCENEIFWPTIGFILACSIPSSTFAVLWVQRHYSSLQLKNYFLYSSTSGFLLHQSVLSGRAKATSKKNETTRSNVQLQFWSRHWNGPINRCSSFAKSQHKSKQIDQLIRHGLLQAIRWQFPSFMSSRFRVFMTSQFYWWITGKMRLKSPTMMSFQWSYWHFSSFSNRSRVIRCQKSALGVKFRPFGREGGS